MAKAPNCALAPVALEEPVQNTTNLRAQALESPVAGALLSFATPQLGEHVSLAEPGSYRVQLLSDGLGPEVTGIELALDSGRPRRLPPSQSSVVLSELLSEDVTLSPGSHWLFAAVVLASGLVPRPTPAEPRAARAVRFFVGTTADEASGPSGAVWLRRPEGSYNGPKSSESVMFDAFVFSALGSPIEEPVTIGLQSPKVNGQVRFASPFLLYDVPSGVYELSASARAGSTSTTHFTVNRELGGGP